MATPASQTTAATIGKGFALVLCAGLACTVTGGAAAVTGASVLGGIIGTLGGGVAGNLATTFVEKLTSLFGGHMSRATADAPNHDLAALATDAVFQAIGAAHAAVGAGAEFSNAIGRIHAAGHVQVAATLANVPKDAMDEASILGVIGTPEGGNSTPTKTPAFWLWVVGDLAKKTDAHRIKPGADASPFHAVKSIFTIAPRPEEADPNADAAIGWLADYLHRHVANQVNDILRSPTEIGRRARIAAEFMYLRAILEAVQSQGQSVTLAPAQLDAIKAAVAERCEALAREPAWFTTANAAFALSLREHAEASARGLSALGADVSAIRVSLDKVLAMLAQLAEQMQRHADESRERDEVMLALLREFKEALAGRTRAAPTDNLAAASVPNNAAKFKGRIDELAELHRRVMDDPPGVPIPVIAEPGLGKSALVTRYVYLHQANFDHVWWVRASNPKGNTAGSAEERSLAALLDLWGIESKAIQGDKQTPRVEALAVEVRTWLSGTKAGGAPARHLLVLDNVDDYATVKRLRLNGPSRVIFTARAAHLARDGAKAMQLKALSPQDGLLVLRAKTDKWEAPAHTKPLTEMGALVGWNALALVYLSAVLARPSTQSPAILCDVLATALAAGGTGPLSKTRDHERPDDHDQKVEEAFALFIAPYAGTPEMALLDAAAFCAPDDIPMDILRAASRLNAEAFDTALDELVSAGMLELDGSAVNIHRLTQMSVRGEIAKRGDEGKVAALSRLLDALMGLFQYPDAYADQLLDHTKTPARMAGLAHAESVIAHAEMFARNTAEGAAAPVPRTPTPAMQAQAAGLRVELARQLADIGQLDNATRHIDAAITWAQAQSPRNEHALAIYYGERARILRDRGLLTDAEREITRAIEWFDAQSPRDERGLAINYASRASIRQRRDDLIGAEADIQKSIDWGEAQSPRDERSLAVWYSSRASIRQDLGDLASAEEDIQKSIDWEESQTQPNLHGLAIVHASRANIRQDRGDLAGAEADIQKSIDWGEAQSPRDERALAIRYASRAGIRRDRGDLAGAEADIKKSIDWGEAQSPRDERSLAIRYASRAGIRRDRGDLAGAVADIQKSIDWGEAQSPRDERALAIRYASRASIRQNRGDLAGAEADIQKSIDWYEAQSPRDERSLAIWYATRASIRRDRGDLAGAEADIQKSIDWGEAQSPRDERGLAIDYAWRARIRRDQKHYPQALADIERSLATARADQPIDDWGIAVWSGDRATILAEMNRVLEAIADIAACIAWYRQHQPDNQRLMARFLRDQARILAQAGEWAKSAAAIGRSLPLHEAVFGKDHEWTKKARAWQAAIAKQQVPPRWIDTKL